MNPSINRYRIDYFMGEAGETEDIFFGSYYKHIKIWSCARTGRNFVSRVEHKIDGSSSSRVCLTTEDQAFEELQRASNVIGELDKKTVYLLGAVSDYCFEA